MAEVYLAEDQTGHEIALKLFQEGPGVSETMLERFRREVAPRFADHGIELVGVFSDVATQELTYLTRFPDEAARKKGWESFKTDAGWLAAKAASETDGPLVLKQRATVLNPVMSGLVIG